MARSFRNPSRCRRFGVVKSQVKRKCRSIWRFTKYNIIYIIVCEIWIDLWTWGFGSRHLQPKAKLVLIGKFLVWRIENIDFHLALLCLKWMIFPQMFFEMSDFPLCSQHHLHPAGHLEVRGPKKGGNVYLDDSWCPQPTCVDVTSTCVDVTFTKTLTQLLSGILKLIRWCFLSKLEVFFKINVTFQRLREICFFKQ